jgi:hypothetical protein
MKKRRNHENLASNASISKPIIHYMTTPLHILHIDLVKRRRKGEYLGDQCVIGSPAVVNGGKNGRFGHFR